MSEPSPTPVIGPAWAARPPPGATTAQGLAARLGAYCWAEQQLFSLLGGWVSDVAETDVKLVLAEHSDHAGWRAERWYELLPTAAPGADALVVAPPGVAEALSEIPTVIDGPGRTVERLSVAYRVLLPRLATALRAHLDWAPPVSEAAVRRVLEISLADVMSDWVVGERVAQALAVENMAMGRVGSVQQWLEQRLGGAGGLLGPGSVGRRAVGGAP